MILEMFKFYFAILLLCHFIGDFYLQTKKMAKSKENDYKKTIVHSILYTVPFFVVFIIGIFYITTTDALTYLFLALAVASISHLIIDLIKCSIMKKDSTKKNNESENQKDDEIEKDNRSTLFFADQLSHILFLATIALVICNIESYVSIWSSFPPNYAEILYFVLLITFVTVPSSIIFKMIFKKYQPIPKTSESIEGAGEIIGFMERILTAVFCVMGQFTAVGFIIAAKSIARYDKISKDGAFAEYYLIGTLFSILVTVAAFMLLCYS